MKPTLFRFLRNASIGVLVLTVFLTLFIDSLLPRFINYNELKNKIEASILQSTGIRAEVKTLSIHPTLLSGIRIVFKNNILFDPAGIKVIRAGKIYINVRYLPLITKHQTSISKVTFANMGVYIGEKSFLFRLKKPKVKSEQVVLQNTQIEFVNYDIVVDRYFDGINQYLLHGDQLALKHLFSNQPLELSGTGTGYFGQKNPLRKLGRFMLSGNANQKLLSKPHFDWQDLQRVQLQIRTVDLMTLSNIFQAYHVPLTAKGHLTLLDLKLQGRKSPKTLFFQGVTDSPTQVLLAQYRFHFDPGKLIFKTKLGLNPQQKLASLSALSLELKSPHFKSLTRGNMLLKNPFDQSQVNLVSQTSATPISSLQLLPNLTLHQRQLLATVNGDFESRSQIQGTVLHPQVQGQIEFKKLALRALGTERLLANQLNGKLQVFSNTHAALEGFQGQVAGSPFRLDAALDLKANTISGNVQAPTLDLGQLRQILVQFGAFTEILGKTMLQGQAGIDLKMQGSLQDPFLNGKLQIRQAQVIDQSSQVKVSNISGNVQFQQQQVTIAPLSGQLQGNPITVTGQLDRGTQKLALRIQAPHTDMASIEKWSASYKPELAKQITLKGLSNLDIQVLGSLQKPDITGKIGFNDVEAVYSSKALTINHLLGNIVLLPQDIRLQGLRGQLNDIPLEITGQIAKDLRQYQVSILAHHVALTQIQKVLQPMAPQSMSAFQQANLKSGTADLNLQVASALATPYHLGGVVQIHQLVARPARIGAPVTLSALTYNVGSGQLQMPQNGLHVGPLKMTIHGTATAKNYQLRLVSERISVEFIRAQRRWIEHILAMPIPTLYNTQGAFQVLAKFTPALHEATVQFFNAGASLKALKYPLYDVNGAVNASLGKTLKASSDNLSFRYANSPNVLSFDMNGLRDIYVEAAGTMAPLWVNDLLLHNNQSSIAYAAIPYNMNLTGSLGNMSGSGAGNNLHMFFNFNIASLFSDPKMEKPAKPGDASLNAADLSSVLHLVGDTLHIEQTRLKLGNQNSLLIEGNAQHVFDPQKRQLQLSVVTEPDIVLSALAKQLDPTAVETLAGKIAANLNLIATPQAINGQGQVTFDHVKSSYLQLDDLDGKIILDGLKAYLDIDHFQSPGVDVGFKATATNLSQYPFPISQLNVVGKEFIVSLFTEWVTTVMQGRLKQGFWEHFFPNTGRLGSLPFDVKDGTIQMKEGIINNLIVNNYQSKVRIYPNTAFELSDIHAESAGGQVKAQFGMNSRANNFMTVHLHVDQMKANAVSRILLNVSNQIFGRLSGVIDYTTEGMTPDAMLDNTNGSAKLRIDNGRLPTVTKMENLLIDANTISGGLANLNLNSILHIADPFKTEYFATLTGTFQIVDGIMTTDDMFSKGKHLDLKFTGSVRMRDGMADMLIHGQMDRDIGGILGPLGNLSVGHVLGILPPLHQIISHIPGVGYVPGFGGPRTDKGLAFEVKIQGPMLDPASTKDFHWVNK